MHVGLCMNPLSPTHACSSAPPYPRPPPLGNLGFVSCLNNSKPPDPLFSGRASHQWVAQNHDSVPRRRQKCWLGAVDILQGPVGRTLQGGSSGAAVRVRMDSLPTSASASRLKWRRKLALGWSLGAGAAAVVFVIFDLCTSYSVGAPGPAYAVRRRGRHIVNQSDQARV